MFGLFEKNISIAPESSRLSPCCFGKMPIHSDFIRYNLATREANALEKWIQEGVGCIARKHPKGWPLVYRDFPLHHFAFSGSEQEKSLIGSLISSQDKSGRIYPFATMATTGSWLFQTNRATLPLVHRKFYSDCTALMEGAREYTTVSTLIQHLEELASDSPLYEQRELVALQIQLLESVQLGEYWNGLQIPVTDREQFWCAFYDIIKSVQNRGPNRTTWGIRIPLPDQDDQVPYVIFWVQMIESILENRFWRAHYFWSRGTDSGQASMTLFFRPLPPSYMLPLLNHNLDDNAVFDLSRDYSSLPAFTSRVDLRRLLENNNAPLLDVLYRTGRREMLR